MGQCVPITSVQADLWCLRGEPALGHGPAVFIGWHLLQEKKATAETAEGKKKEEPGDAAIKDSGDKVKLEKKSEPEPADGEAPAASKVPEEVNARDSAEVCEGDGEAKEAPEKEKAEDKAAASTQGDEKEAGGEMEDAQMEEAVTDAPSPSPSPMEMDPSAAGKEEEAKPREVADDGSEEEEEEGEGRVSGAEGTPKVIKKVETTAPGTTAAELPDDVVLELYKEALQQAIKTHEVPFDINIVASLMKEIKESFAIESTSFGNFFNLCVHMEKEGVVKLTTTREAVLVKSTR
eukprot:gene2302-3026_t